MEYATLFDNEHRNQLMNDIDEYLTPEALYKVVRPQPPCFDNTNKFDLATHCCGHTITIKHYKAVGELESGDYIRAWSELRCPNCGKARAEGKKRHDNPYVPNVVKRAWEQFAAINPIVEFELGDDDVTDLNKPKRGRKGKSAADFGEEHGVPERFWGDIENARFNDGLPGMKRWLSKWKKDYRFDASVDDNTTSTVNVDGGIIESMQREIDFLRAEVARLRENASKSTVGSVKSIKVTSSVPVTFNVPDVAPVVVPDVAPVVVPDVAPVVVPDVAPVVVPPALPTQLEIMVNLKRLAEESVKKVAPPPTADQLAKVAPVVVPDVAPVVVPENVDQLITLYISTHGNPGAKLINAFRKELADADKFVAHRDRLMDTIRSREINEMNADSHQQRAAAYTTTVEALKNIKPMDGFVQPDLDLSKWGNRRPADFRPYTIYATAFDDDVSWFTAPDGCVGEFSLADIPTSYSSMSVDDLEDYVWKIRRERSDIEYDDEC